MSGLFSEDGLTTAPRFSGGMLGKIHATGLPGLGRGFFARPGVGIIPEARQKFAPCTPPAVVLFYFFFLSRLAGLFNVS